MRTKSLTAILFSALLVAACSQEKPVQYTDDDDGSGPTVDEKRRTFSWQTALTDADATSLSLADATAFSITLDSCVSTYTTTVTETLAYLEVYEFDRNCKAKLTTFTLNSKVYVPKTGAGFSTWAASDVATFEVVGASPADELTVTVISTLPNLVVAGGTIHYQFSEITNGGTDTLGEAVVRESASLSVNGQSSPNFAINQVQLVGFTDDGNGEFQIQLKCNNVVTGTGSNIACDDVLLSDIYMTLAKNTFSSALTLSDLQGIMTTASGGVQIDMSTDAFVANAGTPPMTNGGFISAPHGDADVLVMPGVTPMITNPNMVLVLKAGPSYTYFLIDVTTITQSDDH